MIDFYFDYASPWSFLASELLERELPGVSVTLRPIYLRGLEAFASGMPYGPDKLTYLARDFARCAEHQGIEVQPPASFPINGIHALRGALVAEREGALATYHQAVFRAAWRHRRDISDKVVVAQIAAELGLPAVAEGLDDPAIKQSLKERTEAAKKRGVFGVPTFAAGDELFWGHDRMAYVARAAAALGARRD